MDAFIHNKDRILLSAVIALFITAMAFSLNHFFLYNPDSARYAAWANSLAHFNGFTDYTGPEAKRYMVHSPLYSLVLAPIAFLFPGNIIMLKTVNILLAAFTTVVLFLLLKKNKDSVTPFLIIVLFVSHPLVYILSTQLLTEVLFGCGFIVLLFALQKESQEKFPQLYFILTIFSLVVCVFSREIGVLCVPIVILFYIIKKKYTKAILVFFIPLILYVVWFIRNEIYYANIEHTVVRNSLIFFSNTMTASDTNFGIELVTRIVMNTQYYFKEIAILMFSPVYEVFGRSLNIPWMALINSQLPLMKGVSTAVSYSYWLLSILSIGSVVAGAIIEYRHNKTYFIKILFFVPYVFIVLVYPVMDPRFLYPIFLLFLLWIGSTLSYLRQLNNRTMNVFIGVLAVVTMVPNLVWTINFVDTQHRLAVDPMGVFLSTKDSTDSDQHLQIALPLAGDWLNNHGDSSKVVLSRYMELALYLDTKKVHVINRIASTVAFNQVIQDYDIQYIVLTKDSYGWRDYEIQFGFNKRYSFQLVRDFGMVEIYKILPRIKNETNSGKYSTVCRDITTKNYKAADTFFNKNRGIVNYHADLINLRIINKLFQDQLDSVDIYVEQLYKIPQGLAYAKIASIYKTVITQTELLGKTSIRNLRLNILMNLASTYWDIDMNELSLRSYQQCIAEDSSYALPYVFSIIYSFQNEDTLSAVKTYQRMRSAFPDAKFMEKIDTLMLLHDHYRNTKSPTAKAAALEGIFDIYELLGFSLPAIEVAREGLVLNPNRISLFKKLGLHYENENEYYPALVSLHQYMLQKKWDLEVESKITGLKQKLYLN